MKTTPLVNRQKHKWIFWVDIRFNEKIINKKLFH